MSTLASDVFVLAQLPEAERAAYVDTRLLPLLESLARADAGAVTIALSGRILEWLIEKDFHGAFSKLRTLHLEGKLDLLVPTFRRLSQGHSTDTLQHHLQYCLRLLENAGLRHRGGCVLFGPADTSTAQAISNAGFRFAYLPTAPSGAWNDPQTGVRLFGGTAAIQATLRDERIETVTSVRVRDLGADLHTAKTNPAPSGSILLADIARMTPIDPWTPTSASAPRPLRLTELRTRFAEACSRAEQGQPSPAQRERLASAEKFLLDAEEDSADESRTNRRQRATDAISTDVELDYFFHPEIDPTIGWVHVATADVSRVVIDTQLARLYLSADGPRLLEVDDKPRKHNLVAAGATPPLLLILSARDFGAGSFAPPAACTLKVVRESPDIVTIRATSSGPGGATLDLSARAGLGAHLPNATIGYTLEYWLEDSLPEPKDALAVLQLCFQMPAASAAATSVKPLTSVGGVSPQRFGGDDVTRLESGSVEGGLHGVRIIDGVSGYSIDVRSAKQLNALRTAPLSADIGADEGIVVQLAMTAARVTGDDKLNSVFVSIV